MKNNWQLDGEAGPALPITEDALSHFADGVLARAYEMPAEPADVPGPAFASSKRLLVGVGFGVGVVACVVAGWTIYDGPRAPSSPAPLATSAAPIATPAPRPAAVAEQVPSIDVGALPSAPKQLAAPEAPRDLLREANRLRANRRWDEAAALYRRVADARSEESTTAMLALASLRLEHQNDGREARRLYRAVIDAQPNGPLAEEARWGLAMACRALGDGESEHAALDEFLARHPSSPFVPKAERRRAELDAKKVAP